MDLLDIQKEIHFAITPGQKATLREKVAGEFAYLSGRLEEILTIKPQAWNTLRKESGSDKACERAYEATQDGIDEMKIRLRLKSLDKASSALQTSINVARDEIRNNY